MRFTIVVQADPVFSQSARSAFEFCKAALSLDHKIENVFFYSSGTYVASSYAIAPQDEISLHKLWSELAKNYNLNLVVCIAAAITRGLLDKSEAERYDASGSNVELPFILGGLGQLIESIANSDRVITFGAKA